MKKTILLIALVAAVAFAAGYAGLAFAQGPVAAQGYDSGMMGGRGGMRGGGMMGGVDGVYGPLHDYMAPAMAEAFGLSTDELTALHNEGKTLWDVAQEQGLTQEAFFAKVSEVRSAALAEAVADGVVTQEQADWMSQRMGQMQANGGTPGSCTMGGAGRSGGHMGGRWQQSQPTP